MSTLKELAQRGLDYDDKINLMLIEIWDELKAIEPEMADAIESALGSVEFAALMTMGRVRGQPSFLEKLADAGPISSEDIPELWWEFVSQAAENPMGLGREGFTEYQFDHDVPLSRMAERAQKDYESALVDIFKELKTRDPEITTAVFKLWDDVVDAARFLSKSAKGLGGKSPLELIEDGQRKDVLDLIYRLEYGIY